MTEAEAVARLQDLREGRRILTGLIYQGGDIPDAITTILAALERAEKDAKRLRVALTRLLRSLPTDSEMIQAGWESPEINEACDAYDAARAALSQHEQGASQ